MELISALILTVLQDLQVHSRGITNLFVDGSGLELH